MPTCLMKPGLPLFEQALAHWEMRGLTGSDAEAKGDGLWSAAGDAAALREKLAYWLAVDDAPTRQATAEDSARAAPSVKSSKPPRRQPRRYGSHGLHEYKGRFLPQLARALMNAAGAPAGGLVVDPFCGSGTTLVEAGRLGLNAFGLDMNPLSVLLSNGKCQALDLDGKALDAACGDLEAALDAVRTDGLENLDAGDREYLARWFDAPALADLGDILAAIDTTRDEAARSLQRMALSNVLRAASHQKPDDLRVRRRSNPMAAGAVQQLLLTEMRRSAESLRRFRQAEPQAGAGRRHAQIGDARNLAHVFPGLAGQVDAIVTSPPYATALPYLDTDRLSLVALGLLPRRQHRDQDLKMIGNREISERQRKALWADYERAKPTLPDETQALLDDIEARNQRGAAGFRRRNTGALLAQYFLDMRSALTQMRTVLKPGAPAYIVIGRNRTTADGLEIQIETERHLSLLGEDVGLRTTCVLPMTVPASRSAHSKNAMRAEFVVAMEKAA